MGLQFQAVGHSSRLLSYSEKVNVVNIEVIFFPMFIGHLVVNISYADQSESYERRAVLLDEYLFLSAKMHNTQNEDQLKRKETLKSLN